jgi:hypothetical protein
MSYKSGRRKKEYELCPSSPGRPGPRKPGFKSKDKDFAAQLAKDKPIIDAMEKNLKESSE